jgi:hypothetical protein
LFERIKEVICFFENSYEIKFDNGSGKFDKGKKEANELVFIFVSSSKTSKGEF